MDCKDLVVDGLTRVDETMRRVLQGLSAERLAYRPTRAANSIGWLAWHLTRVQDHHVSELAGAPQAWLADGWHARFGRPAEKDDIGYGHSSEQVASLKPEGPQVLLDYYAAVHPRTVAYLQTVTCQDMDRVVDTRWTPPVTLGVRLVSVVNDCTQHVAQMAYIRGLIEHAD